MSAHKSALRNKADLEYSIRALPLLTHKDMTDRVGLGCSVHCWGHSGLMAANLITLPHFSVSSAMSLSKSPGAPATTVPPSPVNFVLIPGSISPALISTLSF